MDKWENLVMWDNVSFYYNPNGNTFTEDELKEIKKTLNKYINNAYNGHIKNNKIDMRPTLNMNYYNQLDYNVCAYPLQIPKKFPEYIFSLLPEKITINDKIITKIDWHSV